MSTFDILERSEESSVPIEVYRFLLGAETFLYTSTEDAITVGADTYTPKAISRGNFGQGRDQGTEMIVRLPQTDPLTAKYINVVPGQVGVVIVIRLQRNESPTFATQSVIFRGRIRAVRFDDDDAAEISCISLESSTSRTVPMWVYSGGCNHALYSPGCGASTTGHNFIGAVSAVSGNTITVSGLSGSGMDFVGGWCRPTTLDDFRMVVAQSGDVLTLLLPFAANPLGLDMQCFEGCDHDLAGDCQTKFGRGVDYGGFYYIPNKDPFRTGVS